MRIPSRVEVLSWNENQVADLLREHKLLDCVDCIFQREIDGQKLLNLKEGDVLYFLEIHDERSRAKFWNIVKRITEKKGGVASLMNKFQVNNEWNNNTVEEDESESDEDSEDSFEDVSDSDDYDEPEEDNTPVGKPVSLERQETIKKNLMDLKSRLAPPQVTESVNYNHSSYPTSEEIYDVPEDGCGEPDDELYDVPSDESGGGVVTRHPALERQESDQYLIPDNTKLIELSQTIDEEDYEDLGGAKPPMGRHSELDMQEEYVVPDTKPAAVPSRPPKPSADTTNKPLPQKAPPVENGHRKPVVKNNSINKLLAKFQEQQTYDPPEPQRDLKKMRPLPNVHTPASEPPKPYPPKDLQKPPAKPPHILKKTENKPPPEVPDVQENYELPSKPPPITRNKKPPIEPEQDTYEPPDQPPKAKKPVNKKPVNKKTPVEIEQDTYEPPDQPPRQPKKPVNKKPVNKKPPVEIEQENYEAPETPLRPSKPKPHIPEPIQDNYEPPEPQRKNKPVAAPVELDPEENYEAPDLAVMNQRQDDADEPEEDYEIPDTSEIPKQAVQESPKKPLFKNLFNRSPSKKVEPTPPPKLDKRKTKPSASLAVPDDPPGRKSPKPAGTTSRAEKSVAQRSSMILPPLPSQGSTSPSLPPKPFSSEKPQHNKPVPTLPQRRIPDLPPSKPPHMTKEQLLQEQPWFHGTISKPAVAEFLKSAKKDGAYLVRNSSRDPGKFTISIYYKNDIRHLNIPCENGHYRLGESGTEKFKSIEELVSYFNKHDVEFSAGGKTPLTHACMRKGPLR